MGNLPARSATWLRAVDSNTDQESILAILKREDLASLSQAYPIVGTSELPRLLRVLAHFDELWVFRSLPSPDLLRSMPDVSMTLDCGPITERPEVASALSQAAATSPLLAVLADGDGLNYFSTDPALTAHIESTAQP